MNTAVVTVVSPPPPPLPMVQKRINSHSNLSDIVESFKAPPLKHTNQRGIQPWEKKARTNYYISRMKSHAKSAQSPDMNLTLREILTGERVEDKIFISLFAYTIGVFFVFFSMFLNDQEK